jgi:hypothetical protein
MKLKRSIMKTSKSKSKTKARGKQNSKSKKGTIQKTAETSKARAKITFPQVRDLG